jgi:hypothetical protein
MTHLADISNFEPDPDALDMLTESMARQSSVLAMYVSKDQLHVIIPLDDRINDTVDKLRFVCNLEVTHDTADETQIALQIAKHYPRPDAEPEVIFDTDLPEILPPIDKQGEFLFLDLIGQVTHQTRASVCFHLGQRTDVLEFSDGTKHYYDRPCVFKVVGWLDVHFPCLGFHKLFIRCSLPPTYASYQNLLALVQCATVALALPSNVSYRIQHESSDCISIAENPKEGFVCRTRWRPPGDAQSE